MEHDNVEIKGKKLIYFIAIALICLLVFSISKAIFIENMLPFLIIVTILAFLFIATFSYYNFFFIFIFLTLGIPSNSIFGQLSFSGISIYLGEGLFFILIFLFLRETIQNPNNPRVQIPINFLNIMVLLFFIIGIRSYLVGFGINPVAARRNLRSVFFFLIPIALSAFIKEEEDIKKVSKILIYSVLVFLMFYIFQAWLPNYLTRTVGSYRFRFTVQMITVVADLFIIQMMIDSKVSFKKLMLYILILSLSAFSIIFSQDRSIWGAMAISLGSLFIVNLFLQKGLKKIYIIIVSAVLIGTALFLFFKLLPLISDDYRTILYALEQRADSIKYMKYDAALQERAYGRHIALLYFKSSPIIGVGFIANLGHDIYSKILAHTGILGGLIWILIAIYMAYNFIYFLLNRNYLPNNRVRSFLTALVALFPAWYAIHYVEPVIWNQQTEALLFMFSIVAVNFMNKKIKRKKRYEKK